MALSLSKGQSLSLSKENFPMQFAVGLGWDTNSTDTGVDFDLDASVVLVASNGKVRSDADFIFYNQMKHVSGAVEHTGDNRTGEGEGDDETVNVNLSLVPNDINKLTVFATIHEADVRKQNFGQVSNAYVRLVDTNGKELVRYDLTEDFGSETAVVFADIYKHNGEWKLKAVGAGYKGGLRALLAPVGIAV